MKTFLQLLFETTVLTLVFAFGLREAGERLEASIPSGDTARSATQPLVLCYHQIRDFAPADTKSARTFIVPVQHFKEQMRLLHDAGFHTILPSQWIGYLKHQTTLPSKPILLTFDDGTQGQYDNAFPELERYGYKATFFIMTVTIGKRGYLSKEEIRSLDHAGHAIGCHTWDHHDVRFYTGKDWDIQLVNPARQLEAITGAPVCYFAYPFGSWNQAAVDSLIAMGYLGAFQLNGNKMSAEQQFTIPRLIVDGHWTATEMMARISR